MVTAPMLTVGVTVKEPETDAPVLEDNSDDEVTLSLYITSGGEFFIQTEDDEPVSREELIPKLRAIIEQRKDKSIWIRADKDITYNLIAKLTADLANNGFNKFKYVHSPDNSEINHSEE
jgi:biopolymer transport protein TolR